MEKTATAAALTIAPHPSIIPQTPTQEGGMQTQLYLLFFFSSFILFLLSFTQLHPPAAAEPGVLQTESPAPE